MFLVEAFLPFLLCASLHYVRRLVRAFLTTEELSIHLFTDSFRYDQKPVRIQKILVHNLAYVTFLVQFLLLLLLVPFHRFEWYCFQHLFAFVQTFDFCWYHTTSPRSERAAMVVTCIAYVCCQSRILDVFVLYAMFSTTAAVDLEEQIFNNAVFTKRTVRILRIVDACLLGLLWVIALGVFISDPNVTDAVIIPCVFGVQYNAASQNKKRI
tara:strand:- start:1286 stop:1918 length:633 start_codon:yes stop_codon:yes gene_type:complete